MYYIHVLNAFFDEYEALTTFSYVQVLKVASKPYDEKRDHVRTCHMYTLSWNRAMQSFKHESVCGD